MDQQQRQAAADHQQKQQQQQQQGNAIIGDSTNRSQRLHQLRAQHQKRHAEQQRHSTHTPTEQFEYEKLFIQTFFFVFNRWHFNILPHLGRSNNKNAPEMNHERSASYDPYNDVRKPRSRAAVGEPNTYVKSTRQLFCYFYSARLMVEIRSLQLIKISLGHLKSAGPIIWWRQCAAQRRKWNFLTERLFIKVAMKQLRHLGIRERNFDMELFNCGK